MGELPNVFYTLDPGLQASGLARWERGRLVHVQLLRAPAKMKGLVERIVHQSQALQEALGTFDLLGQVPIVGERMKHRGRVRGKRPVPPDDLINLSLLSGALCDYWVLPSEWKGTVPRDVEQSRSRAVLAAHELALVEAVLPASLRKEAWSAVGIGLSVLGRAHSKCGWGRWS